MASEIIIEDKETNAYGWSFKVTVRDEVTETKHKVNVSKDYYEKLTAGKITPDELIKHTFEFLLAHEPKESILAEFGLPMIQKYFYAYENSMKFESNG